MRTTKVGLILGCVLITLGGCNRDVPSSSPLRSRFKAAESIADPADREAAFARLTLDAADAGDPALVTEALGKINDPALRDKSKERAALKLGKAGKGDDAMNLAKKINDPSARDQILGKLAAGDYAQ